MSLLDEALADPETHEAVTRATEAQLDAIRSAIRDQRARRAGGGDLPERVEGAYLSHGGRWVYPDAEGFPSLLIEDRIELDDAV